MNTCVSFDDGKKKYERSEASEQSDPFSSTQSYRLSVLARQHCDLFRPLDVACVYIVDNNPSVVVSCVLFSVALFTTHRPMRCMWLSRTIRNWPVMCYVCDPAYIHETQQKNARRENISFVFIFYSVCFFDFASSFFSWYDFQNVRPIKMMLRVFYSPGSNIFILFLLSAVTNLWPVQVQRKLVLNE